jgi:uncharacterized HAD superfamily protein
MNQLIRGSLQKLPWAPEVVAGVHKSGMLAAVQFASYFNVPVVPLRQLWEADWVYAGKRTRLEDQDSFLATGRRVLIVEDSVASGGTFSRELKKLNAGCKVKHEFFKVAVYGTRPEAAGFNLVLAVCPGPRMFEWNWMNNARLGRAVLDIDGVLCKDPPFIEDQKPAKYQRYLQNAVPLFVPKIPVMALATARLERFRPETEAWLAQTGVQYGNLFMAGFRTAAERRKVGNWTTKMAVYSKLPKARLFIESNDKQARRIHQATKRLVICVESGIMYGAKGP